VSKLFNKVLLIHKNVYPTEFVTALRHIAHKSEIRQSARL